MKRQLLFLACIILCLGMISCKYQNKPMPTAGMKVIKFTKPEYKNYILAHRGDGGIVAARFNYCGDVEGVSGCSPYWELPDNWLLVDWKWVLFPNGIRPTILIGKTWEEYPKKPEETMPLPSWPMSEPHDSSPIKTYYFVTAEALAKYIGTTYSYRAMQVMRGGLGSDSTSFCYHAEEADSIWSVAWKHLSIAIQNGDLDKIAKKMK